MAWKLTEIKTKTKTTTDFDDEASQTFKDVNKKAYDVVFDSTHKANKYESVLDEIETQTLHGFEEAEIQEAREEKTLDKDNPFFGDKNALQKLAKHSYKEVVSKPATPVPTLEVKEEIKVNSSTKNFAQTKTKRKKIWQITGVILIVLFLGLFGYNMISINSLAKKIAKMEHQINEQEQIIDGQKTPAEQIGEELSS